MHILDLDHPSVIQRSLSFLHINPLVHPLRYRGCFVKTSSAPPLQQNRSFRWRWAAAPPSPVMAASLAERRHHHNQPPPMPSLPSNRDSWPRRSRRPCLQQSRGAASKKRPQGITGEKQHGAPQRACRRDAANQREYFHPISFSLPKMEDEQMKTSNDMRPWLARIEHIALIASERSRVSKSGPPYQ
jgi:hypothetical protein